MVNPTPLRTQAEEALLKRFPAEKDALPGTLAVRAAREAAWTRFTAVGLPHRRVEDWKYTDLRTNVRAIAPAAGPADVARVKALEPAVPVTARAVSWSPTGASWPGSPISPTCRRA